MITYGSGFVIAYLIYLHLKQKHEMHKYAMEVVKEYENLGAEVFVEENNIVRVYVNGNVVWQVTPDELNEKRGLKLFKSS